MRWLKSVPAALLVAALLPFHASAGTTGGITGRVVDAASQAPLAGVVVTVNSPSQNASGTTDASGTFRFLTLAPDTYTIAFSKDGYDSIAQPGLSVFADQVQTYNATLNKMLKTIGRVTSQAASNLIKPGTTSDVYSINSAGQKAAASLIGPGGLSNAYGAIQSAPGVAIDQGEQGWFQTVHIRGGDIDQVGYELDGIPTNRVYDNAPMTMLSSLGSQEVQVYTGGGTASTDAQGISGFVNQVVKTGTYPGYANLYGAIGAPAFYHQGAVEFGGSTPDRNFSYYVGLGGANQDYRYVDNNDGSGYPNSFFYPINAVNPNSFSPGRNGFVYTGANGVGNDLFAQLQGGFGIAATQQRDSLVNVHLGIPHRNGGLRDDVQLLWMTSELWAQYGSSINDTGVNIANQLGTLSWDDSYIYGGKLLAPPVSSQVQTYFFPNSPKHQFGDWLCGGNSTAPAASCPNSSIRDSNDNGVAVTKLQYQHTFSPSSFFKIYGYSLYSNWFIWGPNTAAQPYYGAELAQYEIPDHTFGGRFEYENQISDQHLLTATYGYTGSNLQRYDVGYIHPNYNIANFVNNGNCYDPASGLQVSCYAQAASGAGDIQTVLGNGLTPAAPGVKGSWLATNNTFNGALNQVHTRFSGWSIADQWRPDDKINVNLGLRVEDFQYLFGNTDYGARSFWFSHYNSEFCVGPAGSGAPSLGTVSYAGGYHIVCPAGETTVGQSASNGNIGPLLNINGGSQYTVARFEPRLGLTYTVSPQSVLRASFGVYARPPNSSWVQYNVPQQDLPTYLGAHFYTYGFNTPEHYIVPDTSYNYDLSWEQKFKGTDLSFKVTPFYRSTKNQLQNFFIDPQGGLESGLNVGHQVSYGTEFALQKGDFSRNGWSGQLAYTYTHSRITYQDFAGLGVNVIDGLNTYIQQYNAYTQAGGGAPCYTYYVPKNGTGGKPSKCGPGTVANPYYGAAPQPLFDRNGSYTTYDVIPGPAAGSNGYETPNVASLIVNYKHDKFAITPSAIYSSGAFYGSPTQWPGYNPQTCQKPMGGWLVSHPGGADPAMCGNGSLPLFIPDKYTGIYDNLGQFQEPWRMSLNLSMEYDVTPRVTTRIALTNIMDYCGQRGYAWDNPYVCVYGSLPSGILYPAGNFYPNHYSNTPPPQLQYPYSYTLNNNNTGFVGGRIPMEVDFSAQIKI